MTKKLNKKKLCITFAVILILAIVCGIGVYNCVFGFTQEINTFEDIAGDRNNIKEFGTENERLTALSDDPWFVYYTDMSAEYTGVCVYVDYLSPDYTYSEFFTSINGNLNCYSVKLHEGANYIRFADVLRGVEYIRFDFLNKTGQEIGIDRVVINDRGMVIDSVLYNIQLKLAWVAERYFIVAALFGLGIFVYFYLKSKKKLKTVLIVCFASLAAMLLHFAAVTSLLGVTNPEQTIEFNSLIERPNVVNGFEVSGDTITAVSEDPWIMYRGSRLNRIRLVTVDVAQMSVESCNSEIFVFYNDTDYISITGTLKQGKNDFILPASYRNIEYLRLDLTSIKNAELCVNSVVFNSHDALSSVVAKQWLNFYSSVAVWLFLTIMPVVLVYKGKSIKIKNNKITAFISKFLKHIIAVLLLIIYFFSFYSGIGAIALVLIPCVILGRFASGNGGGRAKKVAFAVYLMSAAVIFKVVPVQSLNSLVWNIDSGDAVRLFIAAVFSCLIACCVLVMSASIKPPNDTKNYYIGENALIGVVFDSVVIFTAMMSVEVSAKVFFNQLSVLDACRAVLDTETFYLNLLLVAVIYMFLRWLLGWIMGRFVAIVTFAAFFTGNFVKLKYHDSTLKPMDILQINDFLNIVTQYIPTFVFYGIVVLLAAVLIGLIIKLRRVIFRHKPVISMAAVSLIMIVSLSNKIEANEFIGLGFNVEQIWLDTKDCVKNDGVVTYSYIKFREITKIFPKADKNYSKAYMQQLKSEFEGIYSVEEDNVKPDVILVMEESMFDVQNIPDVKFSVDVDANMRKYLKTVTISPKYGGGTGSVEFEALTGMSNYFMLDNVVPYVTYWNSSNKEIPGITREFKNNGYNTAAIHPNDGNAYNRDIIYSCMGFDKFLDKKLLDFSGKNLTNDGYFTDDALADVITNELSSSEEPDFVFVVTIENHTLYENKYKETEVKLSSDKLSKDELHTLEQYSQGVLNADGFIDKMVDYVDNADRPTILYIWGDHLPALPAFSTLGYIDDKYNKYGTPLIAYSNYKDIEVAAEYITPNQLAPQILRDSGIKYSAYFDFIYSLRERWPVIHKEFIPQPDELIKKYEMIQYDVLFGKKYLLGYD